MNTDAVMKALNQRLGRILDAIESAIPGERQYLAVRRTVLAELGRDGFEKDLRSFGKTAGTEWDGTGRTSQGKKGGES